MFNLRADPEEMTNLAGVVGYEHVEAELTRRMLAHLVGVQRRTFHTEQIIVRRGRVP